MAFENGDKVEDLAITGQCGKRNPGPAFDSCLMKRSSTVPILRCPAWSMRFEPRRFCVPGLRVTLNDEKKGEKQEWFYEDGISDYLADATIDYPVIPESPLLRALRRNRGRDWAIQWLPEGVK